jgi:hypothetical protein
MPHAWTVYINLTVFSLTLVDFSTVICLKSINLLIIQLLKNIVQKVDLSKLEMSALWRYWRHFNLVITQIILPICLIMFAVWWKWKLILKIGMQVDAVPNPSKEQLVDVVQRHFMSQVH